jgi:hypothetical protein
MNQTFETQAMPAVIEVITYSNSAFGTNESGQQIFINSRIVERCSLKEGMEVIAHVIPNYEDKRHSIPWRAMRVEAPRTIGISVEAAPMPTAQALTQPPSTPFQLDQEILALLDEEEGYMTTSEIADVLGRDTTTISNSCRRLFANDQVARADVFSGPNQSRASVLLWARSVSRFI